MVDLDGLRRSAKRVSSTLVAGLLLAACTSKESMNDVQLTEFATRYAAAWSSQNPNSLAAFYAEDGSLTVNDGTPSVGRAAVRATAQGFMSGFPDMHVRMDSVVRTGSTVRFHWTWTGTNTGPGGTGRPVHISGYEDWTLTPVGLIARSLGHYDEAEYQRQMTGSGTTAP
ncbi:MAG TPA: nuclear transport factor 2 family protein [Gemmatimonadales bacterium]|nr:nuclear transport factor 2 family protein [Gemmatimonadales bacterium]